jgi:hypothetical protein
MTRYIPEINAVGLTTIKALGDAGEPLSGRVLCDPIIARLARFLIELNR